MSHEQILSQSSRLSYKEWARTTNVIHQLDNVQFAINKESTGKSDGYIYHEINFLQIGSGSDFRDEDIPLKPDICRYKGATGSFVVGIDAGTNNTQYPRLYHHISHVLSHEKTALSSLLLAKGITPKFDVVYIDFDTAGKTLGDNDRSSLFQQSREVITPNGLFIIKIDKQLSVFTL
jgi:hypothetical protein